MVEFKEFKTAVQKQFKKMQEHPLFKVDVTKDELWDTYLDSFPEGTNNIFRERREYDCQCCKQFIRAAGSIVAITPDYKIISLWDIKVPGYYQEVADTLSKLMHSAIVRGIFLHRESHIGTDYNRQLLEDEKTLTWEHFYVDVPAGYVRASLDIGHKLGGAREDQQVFNRAMDELTIESMDTTLELIDQGSLYRGEEHRAGVVLVKKYKKMFDKLSDCDKYNFTWYWSAKLKGSGRVRNSVIGTLLVDLSEGKDLEYAVKAFESKVAPTNYKRPKALVTKSMIANAQKDAAKLGILPALTRRFAVAEDLTINNVLFADRSAKKAMTGDVFDQLADDVPVAVDSLKKVEEVTVQTFIKDILPTAESVELMVENKHLGNFMSLIAPVNAEANPILKWGNNFGWTYKGEVADSMKERVKKAGGSVTGVLRFSIQWNTNGDNHNDFDARCVEPNGNTIYYPSARRPHPSSGVLDVDITYPDKKVAVENITWSDKYKMQEGVYKMLVHNFSHHGGRSGFSAEIEYDGIIHSYEYTKELRQDEKVVVAEFNFSKEHGIKFINSLPSTYASKEVWGIPTQSFHKVTMVMNSPNHWDGEETGNKHYFFILEGCKQDGEARGFYNEFLREDLTPHRKVFEVLGSKMRVPESDNQLSGLGFSSTQRNEVFCKVTGAFTRTIKIKF